MISQTGSYEFPTPGSVISYAWLQDYGLPTDGSADFARADSDPFNNWQEWVALPNPTNAQSCFHITAISDGPPARVTFLEAAGRLYTLFACTNLDAPVWTPVPGRSDFPGTGGMCQLTDTNSAPNTYYRASVRMP